MIGGHLLWQAGRVARRGSTEPPFGCVGGGGGGEGKKNFLLIIFLSASTHATPPKVSRCPRRLVLKCIFEVYRIMISGALHDHLSL